MNEASPGQKRAVFRTWLFAALTALLSQGAWWFVLVPAEAVPRRSVPPGPRLTYMRSETAAAGGLQSLWSPILFSLPTPVGFSRTLMDEQAGLKPPALAAAVGAVYFDRAVAAPGDLAAVRHEGLEVEVKGLLVDPGLAEDGARAFAMSAVSPASPLAMEPLDGFLAEDFVMRDLPAGLAAGADWWEALVSFDVNGRGEVVRAFLEKPTGSARRNHEIVRAVYGWRLRPDGEDRGGRVVIRCQPQGAARADGNGGGR